MGRRGFGRVSAMAEIYRLQDIRNRDTEALYSWLNAAKRLAKLVTDRKYKAARSLAEKIAAAPDWGCAFQSDEPSDKEQ